ncbi:MAG: diaminopimelate epimerase [Cytophagaceae bacterium BCCC1]|nr:MAG: diaminopimelate epimerase [Cytophagaceae bacterium BCCC1]
MTQFFKYQGTGNDFVMIDNREGGFDDSIKNVEFLCHRRFGIGADGLILIEKADGFDFRMRYFNADGKEGSMCGNGGRCAVKFASDLGIYETTTSFIAVDGPHHAMVENDEVSLGMIDVEEIIDETNGYFLNTGSPHLVIFQENLDNLDVKTQGAAIRYSDYWLSRGGVNVNFVQIIDNENLKVRTYERGVEDETFSCGTGVTAAAIASSVKKGLSQKIKIQTLGGKLEVSFEGEQKFSQILLKGPALFVFKGDA